MKAQESMQPGEAVLLGDPNDPGFELCVLIMDETLRVPLGVVTLGCTCRRCWRRGGRRDDVPSQDLPPSTLRSAGHGQNN